MLLVAAGLIAGLATSLAAGTAGSSRGGAPPSALDGALPSLVLWAWDRPEDLRFLDPREVGVALLAATVRLRGGDAFIRLRGAPVAYPPGTALVAVVRIETDGAVRPLFSKQQIEDVVRLSARLAARPGVRAVQIDFDATLSERPFYRRLLTALQAALPPRTALSMTALASWALGDRWLDGLPVDEAVPMLFRMGADRGAVLAALDAGRDFTPGLCRRSVGLSVDEPIAWRRTGRRIYLWSPISWTPAVFAAARAGVLPDAVTGAMRP